jgi:hypothetical protein
MPMSGLDIGRAKTAFTEVGENPGPNPSQQRPVPTMLMTVSDYGPGRDRESHLGGYFWDRFGEEVRRSHADLHRAERMLDCFVNNLYGGGPLATFYNTTQIADLAAAGINYTLAEVAFLVHRVETNPTGHGFTAATAGSRSV